MRAGRRCARRATLHDVFELRDVVRGIEQDQIERSARRARIQKIAADDSTRILLIRPGMRFVCHQAQARVRDQRLSRRSCSTNVTCRAPRDQRLEPERAGAGKRVEHACRPRIAEHIEQRLAQAVGRRPDARPFGATSRRPLSRPR